MAVDSAAKRVSALYFVRHRKGRLIPDGTIASPDFQDIVGFYVGISAVSQVYGVNLGTVSVSQPTITVGVSQPTITASVSQPTLSTITVKNDIT